MHIVNFHKATLCLLISVVNKTVAHPLLVFKEQEAKCQYSDSDFQSYRTARALAMAAYLRANISEQIKKGSTVSIQTVFSVAYFGIKCQPGGTEIDRTIRLLFIFY